MMYFKVFHDADRDQNILKSLLFIFVDKIFRNSKILMLADLAQLVEQRTRNA